MLPVPLDCPFLLAFLGHLKTTQPKVSERIINVRAQVKASGATFEDDFGNDFDPGMILN
jgi:hypothetical protein